MPTRLFAVSTLPALALVAACAPANAGKDGDGGPSPARYELAMVQEPESSIEAAAPAVVAITPDALRTKLAAGNIRLIDVRTDEEVAEGMISGAEHIALDRFDPATLDLSDGREVVLYCRSDRRSGIAAEKLAAFTGKPAEHLAGGIMAWQEAGGAVETR